MKNFELGLKQGDLDERIGGIGMPVGFPVVQVFLQVERRGRNENGLFDRCALQADPVLGGAEVPAGFAVTTHAVHQDCVEFEECVEAERSRLQELFRPTEGPTVVDDLMDVFTAGRIGRCFASLELQDVLEVRLCAFDF